ncbi:MAG: leucyl/phenylalanyl-tRNA--protein transferase [Rickettsiales bacterium]|nr:leucyl/phenylalanyl-tRNA--protein transferase [Rickettsiales bacterium]OUV52922.1 MAG: leucyl/phenylalanyl-tRNA--protein transferase [Rickettsiales bacterium TMED127]|tara:strand:+ start:26478 stop:27104 length:627 start_codon:yes stop_codon:yes gene_type:complete
MFLSPNHIIEGYKKGIFPMSNSSDDPYIFWVSPEKRGIIELEKFRLSKSLKKEIRKNRFKVQINKNFKKVIDNCRKPDIKRESTWINQQIIDNYCYLFLNGYAVSVETYENNQLVGGLYGVKIGGLFFGESMFSKTTNASKVALVFLAAHLKQGGFQIIDTQFLTKHLEQFGATEVCKKEYLIKLRKNIKKNIRFPVTLKKNVLDYFS